MIYLLNMGTFHSCVSLLEVMLYSKFQTPRASPYMDQYRTHLQVKRWNTRSTPRNHLKLVPYSIMSTSYGYGSIPIHTIFRGLFTSILTQLFWGSQKGYYWFWHVLTHPHIPNTSLMSRVPITVTVNHRFFFPTEIILPGQRVEAIWMMIDDGNGWFWLIVTRGLVDDGW